MIRFHRRILIDLENCLSSFVGMLLGPSDLHTLNVLIISSVSSGVAGLKEKVFQWDLLNNLCSFYLLALFLTLFLSYCCEERI